MACVCVYRVPVHLSTEVYCRPSSHPPPTMPRPSSGIRCLPFCVVPDRNLLSVKRRVNDLPWRSSNRTSTACSAPAGRPVADNAADPRASRDGRRRTEINRVPNINHVYPTAATPRVGYEANHSSPANNQSSSACQQITVHRKSPGHYYRQNAF